MKVNTKKLKDDLNLYNELLKEYEENYLNYYNVVSSFSFFWNDGHSRKFYEAVPKERMHYKNILYELNPIKDVYKYICAKYSELGEKIYIELKSEDVILSKFNNYIDKINAIINMFNNLSLSFCQDEAWLIVNQKDKLIKIRNQMEENEEQIKEYFYKIRQIEQTVKYKLKNIDISYIKETDISKMV